MTTSPRPAIAFATSVVVFALIAATLGLLLTSCASSHSPGASSSHAADSTAEATAARATSKQISFDGVQLTIPAGWPVIDGAHAQYTCSATFFDQADRAFLGPSDQAVPSCPPSVKAPSPADGVWLQSAAGTPSGHETTLPGGQRMYLATATQTSAVTVWYHGVSIQIGIGANRAVERSILDSIAYRRGIADTPVLGRCPAQDPHPAMPVPRRLTAPLVLGDQNGSMRPESPNVRPRVSAASAWHGFIQDFGAPDGALRWSIVFGSYSAQTPATIGSDGSATPDYQGVPTWLIRGQGVPTAYGPCGVTLLAPYDADTGRGMGVTVLG